MENMGLGVLSRRCVARVAQEGALHTLSIHGYPMNRYFQICYALRRPVTSQMRDFMQTARQTIAQEIRRNLCKRTRSCPGTRLLSCLFPS